MIKTFGAKRRRLAFAARTLFCSLGLAATVLGAGSAVAQVRTVDPDTAIDADLAPGAPAATTNPAPAAPAGSSYEAYAPPHPGDETAVDSAASTDPYAPTAASAPATAAATAATGNTATVTPAPTHGYQRDDVIAGAEGVFGKGAEGLAGLIEKILKDQGEPIGYIAGREASGAIVVGLRYGSGTLTHKIEGERKVYWTGPSIGLDFGGNASKVFVLVYNLYDTQELFQRYPQIEGTVYVVGGFTATYLRRGNVVLIPIRLGVGWRLGINAGYMKFSEEGKLLPF